MKALTDYLGRSVRVTDERLRHIMSHPEMADLEPFIAIALREPDVVVQSRTDGTVQLCHRKQVTEKFGEKWLCVAVKYVAGRPLYSDGVLDR